MNQDPPSGAIRPLGYATVLTWVSVLLPSCGSEEPPLPADFVGRAACARCHEEQAEAWRGSHHDLAMQQATPATVLGDFDGAAFDYAGVTTTFFRQGERLVVRTDGPDGELRDHVVRFTFGFTPLQQYLVELPGGRLQALTHAWDTRPAEEGGQRWFHLHPGETVDHEDPLHWTGPLQNWNFMCAECHSTGVRKGYDAAHDVFATTWREIDVSCEACHGPGSRHVAWAEAAEGRGTYTGDAAERGLLVRLPEPPVWNFQLGQPTALPRDPPAFRAEIETCARCHSRRTQLHEPYVHGRPLLDTHLVALLEEGLYFADGQIRDEVFVYGSFLQSKMYAAGVDCSDCHEPHGLGLRAEGNALCARCHLASHFDTPKHHFHERGEPGSACVDCHMPSRTYMVVDPRRDHGMRVPRPDLTVKLGTPNACNGCHSDRSPRWAATEIAKRYGPDRPAHWGETLHAGRRSETGAARDLLRLAVDPERPGIVRATALSLLAGRLDPDTIGAVRSCLADGEGLVRLGALHALEGSEPMIRAAAAPLLRDPLRTIRAEAARLLADAPASELGEDDRAALEDALKEYVASQEFNADRGWAHVNLGLLDERLGRPEAAVERYLQATKVDRSETRAYANLADLHRSQGRDDLGEEVLRRGLKRAGDPAALHHALGLLLVRKEDTTTALSHLATAAELRPEVARYAYVYGVAVYSTGDRERAMRILARAWERHPSDRSLLSALVSYNLEMERTAEARRWLEEWLRRFPDDVQARTLQRRMSSR